MNEKPRRKKIGFKIRLILFAALALLLAGLGFGTGLHFGGNGPGWGTSATGSPEAQNVSQSRPSAPETAAPQATPSARTAYEIIVDEKDIYYNGRPYSLQALRETLMTDSTGTKAYTLVDRHAIKSVYDACKATLDELNISYTEK